MTCQRNNMEASSDRVAPMDYVAIDIKEDKVETPPAVSAIDPQKAHGMEILAAFSPLASPSGSFYEKRSVKYNILSGTDASTMVITMVTQFST
ncbi:hypothetical protein Tco_1523900 [Tanacetum coccineum]